MFCSDCGNEYDNKIKECPFCKEEKEMKNDVKKVAAKGEKNTDVFEKEEVVESKKTSNSESTKNVAVTQKKKVVAQDTVNDDKIIMVKSQFMGLISTVVVGALALFTLIIFLCDIGMRGNLGGAREVFFYAVLLFAILFSANWIIRRKTPKSERFFYNINMLIIAGLMVVMIVVLMIVIVAGA